MICNLFSLLSPNEDDDISTKLRNGLIEDIKSRNNSIKIVFKQLERHAHNFSKEYSKDNFNGVENLIRNYLEYSRKKIFKHFNVEKYDKL